MKFLCGNCKAKYQIADEKIAGRTLRMKCRRCSHDIVLRGTEMPSEPGAPASASRGGPASASRRRGPAPAPAPQQKVARRPAGSALGADFRREVASAPQSPPERVSPLDQWHVAINDVPVGPIKRDEIARKVIAGAVNGDSLCWREGFDDWRPLKEVPELAAVLQKRAAPPRPPPPAAALRGGSGARSRPRSASTSRSSSIPARTADASRPAARSNVVPIGGRLGAAAAPAFEEPAHDFDDLEGEPTRVSDPLVMPPDEQPRESQRPLGAPVPAGAAADPFGQLPAAQPSDPFGGAHAAPLPDAYSTRPARRGLPVGAWIAIAGAGAFGMMLAAMVGTKLLSDDEAPAVAAVDPSTTQQGQATPELVVPDEIEAETETEEAEEETTEESGEAARPRTGGTRRTTGGSESTKTKQLTAEERALLERFGGESGAAPSNIRVNNDQAGDQRRGQVDAAALNAVVSRNRPALRRCYEIAIRGMGDPPTVRVNVRVSISGAGRVSSVTATANGQTLSGLSNCVESAVRRWAFPAGGQTVVTEFPVVFAPGS